MRRVRCSLVAVLLVACAAGCARRAAEPSPTASSVTVYTAQTVRTQDPERPRAEAFAVRDGKVLAVGSRQEVLAAAGAGARVVDLGEATVVPGLTDAHGHLASLGRALATVRLEETRSRAEILERLKAAPTSAFQGDWLVGSGWDQNDWPEKAFPDRTELDARWASTPVALDRVDGHALWVNGEALRRARITRDTKDPEGGRILRGPGGEPTGVLVDNAMNLVYAVMPPPTDAQHEAQLGAALARCAAEGMTGVHDAGMDLRTFRLLQRWDAEGRLPLRVYAMADGQGAEHEAYLAQGPFQGDRLTMRAVKLLADGALGSRGAALHTPYSDEAGHRGLLLLTPEQYEARVRAFTARGFQVATHAIGDRANTLVLDTLLKVVGPEAVRAGRHRVEHAQVMRLEDIQKLGAHGIIASVQPTHATSDMPWAEARVGPERIQGAYAWQRLKAAGATLALGSDFPVERPDMRAGLYAARTRQDAAGHPPGGWFPAQRLSGEEALEGFTRGPAFAAFAEGGRGQLKPGMDADFVALSVDPVDGAAEALLTAQVRLTVVAGAEVYRAP